MLYGSEKSFSFSHIIMKGERQVERYREAGINWWNYCGAVLVNSYPTYFEKLLPLLARVNREKRNSMERTRLLHDGDESVKFELNV